ncbi:MAG: hypothetical protein ACI8YQ_000249 [Polaribacter sp.]|jgi:hypothetical protein
MSDYNRIIILVFWIWATMVGTAQEILMPIKDFCQPGVEHKSPGKGVAIEYGYFPGYRQVSSSEEEALVDGNHHFLAKFKVPILIREKTKILLGARYFEEVYLMNDLEGEKDWLFYNMDGKKLKSHRFSAYLSRSFGHQHYFGLKAELSYNGDYDSFLSLDRRYRESYLVGVIGKKKNASQEWGLGMITRFGYRGIASYPFLIYNKTFNEHWGIESTIPVKFMIRYRFNPSALLLFGGEMASRNYSVDLQKGKNDSPLGSYTVINPEAQFNISYQQQITKWIWLEVKTGYIRYLKSAVNGKRAVSDIDFNIDKKDSGFFKIGLFLSPPKSYFEKGE